MEEQQQQQQQKICSSVINDSMQLPSSSGLQYPWLVSYMCKEGTDQIFFSSTTDEHYHCRIPELFGRKIRGCFHGWLILSKFQSPDLREFCLWNPVSQGFIDLPPLKLDDDDDDDILSYFLSSPPSNPDSVVLLSRYTKSNLVFCLLYSETKTWTEISYAQQIRDIYIPKEEYEGEFGGDRLINTPVCCNNKVYAITSHEQVIQIDILVNHNYENSSEVVINLFHCTEIPDYKREAYDFYLVGSCNELFTIIVSSKENPSKEIQSIELFKLDFSTMNWEEIKSSSDRVFFLVDNSYSQISCPAIESHPGSCVHIIQDTCKVYSYNMEDKTISLSYLCCPDIQPAMCPHHTSLWILPESRIADYHGEAKSISDIKEQGKEEEIVVSSIVSHDERMMNELQLGEKMKSHLLDIPFHILELIVEHCVAVEYLNFRATCKHFQLAAPSIQWSTATALGRLQAHSLVSPWLMVIDKHQDIITLKDPKLGDKYFMTTSAELIGDAVICSSRYGWLLIFTGMQCPHFFNPLTRAIIRLPNLVLACYSSFAFSALPTSPDCIVVVGLTANIDLISPGQPEWCTVSIDRNIQSDLLSSHKCLAFCGRNLYFFSSEGKLGVFRTNTDSCEFLVHDPPKTSSFASCGQRFLVECNHNLISIVVGEIGKWVEVFKLNHSTLKWEKVNSSGKHMIFICGTESFSAVAKISRMENKIYFPRFYGGKIVFYSLDTCKYQTFGDNGKDKKEAFMDFSPTIEQLLSAWIEPSWSV